MVADAAGMMCAALMCEELACWLSGGIFRSAIDVKGCSVCLLCVCVHGVPVYVGNHFSLMESAPKDCDGKLFCSSYPNNASKHMSTTRVVRVGHSGKNK